MPAQRTTRLFLVRHGATQLSAEDRFAGSIDPELSEMGIFQAERLAERLAISSQFSAMGCARSATGIGKGSSARMSRRSSLRNMPPGRKIHSPLPHRVERQASM
jgi:hypothetical protein